MQEVIEFYNAYDEENRLSRHKTEFAVTTCYLNEHIKTSHKILDVAAGTGAYALYYAERGCKVDAADVTPKHIEILNNKGSHLPNLKTFVNDACDLSKFQTKCYNVVLNMGPVYHLEDEFVLSCINESIRVLKPGGMLAIAYVNKFNNYQKDKYYSHFKFHSYIEIENIISCFPIQKIFHKPVDGLLYENLKNGIDQGLMDEHECHRSLEDNPINFDLQAHGKDYFHGLVIGVRK